MNELLKMNAEDLKIDGRELHKALEIKTQYTKWFERMCEYGFTENVDYTAISQKSLTAQGNSTTFTNHLMSVDMAKEICMIQRSQKGKEFRAYFIDVEKKWNDPKAVLARALQATQQQLESEKKWSKALEKKVEEDKPKVIFADAVTASESSIRVRDLAKLIKQNGVDIGEKRLYKWLRENGYICKFDTTPTQKAMQQGLFEVSIHTIQRADGNPLETRTTKVTGKGQQYFVNKFLS